MLAVGGTAAPVLEFVMRPKQPETGVLASTRVIAYLQVELEWSGQRKHYDVWDPKYRAQSFAYKIRDVLQMKRSANLRQPAASSASIQPSASTGGAGALKPR